MDLDGVKQVVRRGVPVGASERPDEVMPTIVRGLLDVPSSSRVDLLHGFGEEFGPSGVHGWASGDFTSFVHDCPACVGADCG